jgi:hypothetical protein
MSILRAYFAAETDEDERGPTQVENSSEAYWPIFHTGPGDCCANPEAEIRRAVTRTAYTQQGAQAGRTAVPVGLLSAA